MNNPKIVSYLVAIDDGDADYRRRILPSVLLLLLFVVEFLAVLAAAAVVRSRTH